jgi:hypothetical protein
MAQDFGATPLPPEAPRRNNNTVIIIVAVVVVLLLCCCCLGIVAWNFGDAILQGMGIYY